MEEDSTPSFEHQEGAAIRDQSPVTDFADAMPSMRNEGEGSSPGSDEEARTSEAAPTGESGDDQSKLFESDYFRMHCMKVLPCNKGYRHDWTVCPYVHEKEKARRRPLTCNYTGIACPEMKKFAEVTERMGTRSAAIRAGAVVSDSVCPRGDVCPYAHNVFEYWLHPTRYRTQMCNDGSRCNRNICFFAHCQDQIRVPKVKPFVSPEMLAHATLEAQRKKAVALKEKDATLQGMQNWMELLMGGSAGNGGVNSLAQVAQLAALQARAQANAGRAQEVRQVQALLEAIQQSNNQGLAGSISLPPHMEAIIQNAGLMSYANLNDRQGLESAFRSASDPRGLSRHSPNDLGGRTLSSNQASRNMQGDVHAAFNLNQQKSDFRNQFRAQMGIATSEPLLQNLAGLVTQGLDMSALGSLGLGTNLPLPQTRHSFDFLPRVPVQPPAGLPVFTDSLGMQAGPLTVDALGLGCDTAPALSAASTVPPADWEVYRGLASPVGPKDMMSPMDFHSPVLGEQALTHLNTAIPRDSLDSQGGSSRSRRTSQDSSRSNTSYHDASSRHGNLMSIDDLRRLSMDSSNYVPSRMSMESNAGFIHDASSRLSSDQESLAFDETFKRMSLDHPQFAASLGAPLETVAERQELESRMYNSEMARRQQAVSPNTESAYLTAIGSSLFGSSSANSNLWPFPQYRSTADSSPYSPSTAVANPAPADWKVNLGELGRQGSQTQLPPRMPSPSSNAVAYNEAFWRTAQ